MSLFYVIWSKCTALVTDDVRREREGKEQEEEVKRSKRSI